MESWIRLEIILLNPVVFFKFCPLDECYMDHKTLGRLLTELILVYKD